MKKIFCLFLTCLIFQASYAAVNDSSNSFEIELTQIPSKENNGSKHKKLSDGAVTAITLGSVFGGIGALGGAAYYFSKRITGFGCNTPCTENTPYQIVGIENPEIITKSCHTYLIKAYEKINKESAQKFLIIPDRQINPNEYNVTLFEIPEEFINSKFEIVQASSKLNTTQEKEELKTQIISKNSDIIKTSTAKINSKDGIIIKEGKLTGNKESIFELNTSYETENNNGEPIVYAIIVGFYN